MVAYQANTQKRARPSALNTRPDIADEELLIGIMSGSEKAYNMLANRYARKIWRLAVSILKDEQEAEDAVQDVFLSLTQNLEKWDPNGSAKFSTWIYRVAFNKCIDIKRKRKPTESAEELELKSGDKSAYHETLDHQISTLLSGHLGNLPDAQKTALELFYYQELSVEEIATHLDNTVQGVRSLLKRGKAALRDSMRYDRTFQPSLMHEVAV